MWGERIGDWTSGFCGFGPSFGHGPFFFSWLLPVLFWGCVIFAIVAIVKGLFRSKTNVQADSALAILRDRFASGEITEKEYTTQKTVLEKR